MTDGQRVYALFGDVGVYCFDMEGRPVWQKAIAPHKRRLGWGTAASPVLHGDRLYLVDDNEEQSYLLALDKRSGEEVWRVDRDEKSNWSTPYVWQTPQRTEIVTPGTGKVRSYDLDGKLLWWFRGMSGITIGTPYADQGLLYLSRATSATRRSRCMPFAPAPPAIFRWRLKKTATCPSPGAIGPPPPTTRRRWSMTAGSTCFSIGGC